MSENGYVNSDAAYDRHIRCPHCSGNIRLAFRIRVSEGDPAAFAEKDAKQAQASAAEKPDWINGLDPTHRDLIEDLRKAGVFEPFGLVVRRVKLGQMPSNLERFFLTVLRTAVPMVIPRHMLTEFCREFPGRVEILGAQGVLIISTGGEIRAFAPSYLIPPAPGKSPTKRELLGLGPARPDPAEGLREWVRTRYGYVPAGGLMLNELRKRSIGEFARPGLL